MSSCAILRILEGKWLSLQRYHQQEQLQRQRFRRCRQRDNNHHDDGGWFNGLTSTIMAVSIVTISGLFYAQSTSSSSTAKTTSTKIESALLPVSSFLRIPFQTSILTHCDDNMNVDKNNNNNDNNKIAVQKSPFYGISPTVPFRYISPNDDLEICFDTRTRTPVYVIERLTPKTLGERGGSSSSSSSSSLSSRLGFGGGGGGQRPNQHRRRPNFYEDRVGVTEPNLRSTLAHYKGSGYDRGHLAPAADFPTRQHDTYTLCNVVPQNHTINVSIWNSLEEWIRRVCRRQYATTTTTKSRTAGEQDSDNNNDEQNTSDTTEMYVVTGPLWLPRRKLVSSQGGMTNDGRTNMPASTSSTTTTTNGIFEYQYHGIGRPPSLVSVPTHLFKVVVLVDPRRMTITHFACFVVHNFDTEWESNNNNASRAQSSVSKTKLEDYLVSWKDLESVSGLQFFPNLVTKDWKDHADELVRYQIDRRNHHHHTEVIHSPRTLPSQTLLLLPSSSSEFQDDHDQSHAMKPASRRRRRPKDQTKYDHLVHLCMDGKCR